MNFNSQMLQDTVHIAMDISLTLYLFFYNLCTHIHEFKRIDIEHFGNK